MIRISFFVFLFFLLPGLSGAKEFTPQEMKMLVSSAHQVFASQHYRKIPIDDAFSEKLLAHYLHKLDSPHLAFFAHDIEDFRELYGTTLDDALIAADPEPALFIFRIFRNRMVKFCEKAQTLLIHAVDFSVDESIEVDRSESSWPESEEEQIQLLKRQLKRELLDRKLKGQPLAEALPAVAKQYSRLADRVLELDSGDALKMYLNGLGSMFDPHTGYLSPIETEILTRKLNHQYVGIGLNLKPSDSLYEVSFLVPDGPAERNGKIRIGDKIVGIAEEGKEPESLLDKNMTEVSEMMLGAAGTAIELVIVSADIKVNLTDPNQQKRERIIREKVIEEQQLADAQLIEHRRPDGGSVRLGVLQLREFYAKGSEHLQELTRFLVDEKQIEGLILDIRDNGGGHLKAAIDLASLFLNGGAILQVQDSNENIMHQFDTPGRFYDMPLVVLTNGGSASSSEIVAGALQDHGRAIIVGEEKTFGKGSIQTLRKIFSDGLRLPNNKEKTENEPTLGSVKVTGHLFFRPSGEATESVGVTPDIILHPARRLFGKGSLDHQMKTVVSPAPQFKKTGKLVPALEWVRRRSDERIASHSGPYAEFLYAAEDRNSFDKEAGTICLKDDFAFAKYCEEYDTFVARKNERLVRPVIQDRAILFKPRVDQEMRVVSIDSEPVAPMSADQATNPKFQLERAELRETMEILSDLIEFQKK